jgi:hypothetical protein
VVKTTGPCSVCPTALASGQIPEGSGCAVPPDTNYIVLLANGAGTCHAELTFGNGATSSVDVDFMSVWIGCGSDPHGCGQGFLATNADGNPNIQVSVPGSLCNAARDAGPEADAPGEAAVDAGADADGSDAACTPRTCEGAGLSCGFLPDGCGSVLDCGNCPSDGGVNECMCQPMTCDELGPYACGLQSDGCGGVTVCGLCPTDAGPCIPVTCADYGPLCGQQPDGCGGLTPNCGTCTAPQYCGGGGPSQCGPVTSAICGELGSSCGMQEWCVDSVVDCGTCPAGEYCGALPGAQGTTCGAEPLDGGSGCVPLTCTELGYGCGTADNGCGGTLDCGTCTPPAICSGGGGYNLCGTLRADGGPCLNCADLSASGCGFTDGCGHLIDCSVGGCPGYPVGAPVTCGGAGIPYQCGSGGVCKPVTCAQLGFNCGSCSDGCGGVVDCGPCSPPQVCGGGGFNLCGVPADAGSDGG